MSLKNEYAKNINSYILEQIKFADTKAATILTFLGVIGGSVFALFKMITPSQSSPTLIEQAVIIVGVISFSFVFVFALRTVFHLFDSFKPDIGAQSNSLNSFPVISEFKSPSEYLERLKVLKDDDLADEYSKHNWKLAQRCYEKNSRITAAIVDFKYFIIFTIGFLFVVAIYRLIQCF